MTKDLPAALAPTPLETYCQPFDPLLGILNQHPTFRSCL
jgi:hypothetical protein